MDTELLQKEISAYLDHRNSNPEKYADMTAKREKHATMIREWTEEDVRQIDESQLYQFIAPLWAMLIWGNKNYVVDKLIAENGLNTLRTEIAELIWGQQPVGERWDRFRQRIKGMGPAMMSEILCHMHPEQCAIWNRRAKVGLTNLGVDELPKHNYQLTGERYESLSMVMQNIAKELRDQGLTDANLLTVDYFIWDHLQSDTPLTKTGSAVSGPKKTAEDELASEFIHNEVRDKLADIGAWLGFSSNVEVKVADGSKVDAIWQATIGNMGRVIYVFEVQTKGSIDSLILNLLKSLKNPAVQGVVAVSDGKQLEKIMKHAADVSGLESKLKYWDYEDVLKVHSSLEGVNESINTLGLVPQGFAF